MLKGSDMKTPLETLVFEECNISPEAIKNILALPRALKRLNLGERNHHFNGIFLSTLPMAGNGLVEALAMQASVWKLKE